MIGGRKTERQIKYEGVLTFNYTTYYMVLSSAEKRSLKESPFLFHVGMKAIRLKKT